MGDPIELDAMYKKPQLSKEKRDKQRQKGLCYEYGLLGHQAASYKQKKKGKGPQKRSINAITRMLGVVLRPDPKSPFGSKSEHNFVYE
jgi:hypothetical protein